MITLLAQENVFVYWNSTVLRIVALAKQSEPWDIRTQREIYLYIRTSYR